MEGQWESAERTRRDDIVHYQHRLAWGNRVLLDLEEVLAVLLFVAGLLGRAWQLARLPHGGEAGAQAQGEGGAEEEAAGVQADDDVWGAAMVEGEHLELEGADEGGVEGRVGEEGEDIDEVDAGDGEVGEVSQGRLELYLCTGEFGGTGGSGGGLGLESRGMGIGIVIGG